MNKEDALVHYLRQKIEQVEQKDPTKLIVAVYGSVAIAALALYKHEWEPLSLLISVIDLSYLADWGLDVMFKGQATHAIIALEGPASFEAVQHRHSSTHTSAGLYVAPFLLLGSIFVFGLVLDYHWLGFAWTFGLNVLIVVAVLTWTIACIRRTQQQVISGWDKLTPRE
jgi:hypothetical protein